jgi:intron-binding protein aquarius
LRRYVTAVQSERELTVCEQTARLVFLIHVFQSLEDEMVRAVALPLVSLPLWANLSPGRLQLELSKNAQLEKHWRYLMKKEAKVGRCGTRRIQSTHRQRLCCLNLL